MQPEQVPVRLKKPILQLEVHTLAWSTSGAGQEVQVVAVPEQVPQVGEQSWQVEPDW